MGNDFEVIGKIVVDQSGAVSIQGISEDVDKIKGSTDALSGATSMFGDVARFVWANIVLEGIKSAVNAVWDFAKSTVTSAMDSQNALADLDNVIRSTGGAAGVTSEELQAMANQLQGVTKFSDETIIKGQSMLLTFTSIGKDIFPAATEAMLDLSQKMGGDVSNAAIQLGKALNDPVLGVGALKRVGVSFTEDQKEQIKVLVESGDVMKAQTIILDELAKEFGGTARAAGETFSGQIEIAKNKLDNLKELIGGPILYAMGQLTTSFTDFGDNPVMQAITTFLTDFNKYLSEGVDPLLAIGYALNNLSTQTKFFEDMSAYINLGPNASAFFKNLAIDVLQLWDALNTGTAPMDALIDFFNKITGSSDFLTGLIEAFRNGDPMVIYNYLGTAINNIDWAAISQRLSDGFKSIDWVKVGAAIRTGLGIVLAGLSLLEELLITMINKTDWGAVAKALGSAIAGLVAGLFGYVNWDALMVDFKNGFVYIGQQALNGLASIWGYSAWANFANDLKNGFQLIVDKVKAFLGIASPSTVFASIGKSIVDGLIAGWNNTIGAFLSIIGKTISDIGNLFGIDLGVILKGGSSASGLGSAGGGVGSQGGGSGSQGGAQTVNNYFYGPVYFSGGTDGANYDCPSPNPIISSTSNIVGGLAGAN